MTVLDMRGISKAFGGTAALDDVDFSIEPGEIHALLGHNGSGKSTLIKVLAGFHAPDSGSVVVRGGELELPMRPGDAQAAGIHFVHQDLALVPSLSVVENLVLPTMAAPGTWRISLRREARTAQAMLARYGLDLDVRQPVAELRPVERAMVAIVRAVDGLRRQDTDGGVLVLDEPTVFLPAGDVDHLFALVREAVRGGASVLFVSHDLEEVDAIADRVTVLRDGRRITTQPAADVSREELVRLIVGREIVIDDAPQGRPTPHKGRPALTVTSLSGTVIRDLSLRIELGEVVGVTGLAGSGFEELPYLLFGASSAAGGSIGFGDRTIRAERLTPDVALSAKAALIPANRLEHGSVASLSVLDNLSMQVYRQYGRGLLLRRTEMIADAEELLQQYDVRPPDPTALYGSLSGGNQQKVMMARWLRWRPRLLLLHEPTQGVDVGASEDIFRLIRLAAEDGASVVCASADHGDLARLCDRVLVLGRGAVVADVRGSDVTEERLATECYRSVDGISQQVML